MTNCSPSELAEAAASSPRLLAELWAEWCPTCRVLTGALERLEGEYADRVRFVRLDHGEHPEVAAHHGIRGLPALLFFRDGELAEAVAGFVPAAALRARLERFCISPGTKQ
jgi:thioredoxin-like negative regulator of GroEL